VAGQENSSSRRRSGVSSPAFSDQTLQLIPFDEVSRRLALSRRSHLGLQEIAIDRIVGSVDRSADFRRDFRPQRRLSRSRLANLRAAFPDGVMPAITVFEVGGAYFVEDGHHRVALARERGADYIDAEVTRLETRYEIGRDTDVVQLIHTEQQRQLLETSGLSRARPDAVIEFTFVDGYTQLAEIINAHGYELARRAGELPTPEQVAADWYDKVYFPGLDAIRRAGLFELYASWNPTEADHFLWVYKIRRDLRARDASPFCSEALANVARHSGATAAEIDVTAAAASVVIEVSDDGRGGATLERGLRGLSDRAEALGGVLTVDSPTGGPTAIRLELPVRSPAGTYN
jgi:hypothetical protein